jgi:hypothetical protein
MVPERKAKLPVQAINGRCRNVVIALRGLWFGEVRHSSARDAVLPSRSRLIDNPLIEE